MPVMMSCPNCGDDLVTVDTSDAPTWAPYLCAPCARAWWPSELTPAARRAWQPDTRTHSDRGIVAGAYADRDAAVARKHGG